MQSNDQRPNILPVLTDRQRFDTLRAYRHGGLNIGGDTTYFDSPIPATMLTTGRFVWVYEISGSVPGSHLGGWDRAEGWRQNPVSFPAGGSTINGVSKPGEIVVSRVFIADGVLQADLMRGSVVELPKAETRRRKELTNPEWPIAHVVLHGVSRDQFMARHKVNHAQLVYAPDVETADRALVAKAAMLDRMGIRVNLAGQVRV